MKKTLTEQRIKEIFREYHTGTTIGKKGSGKSVLDIIMADAIDNVIVFDMLGVFDPESRFKTAVLPGSVYYGTPADFINGYRKDKNKHIVSFADVQPDELIDAADRVCDFILKLSKSDRRERALIVDEVADIAPESGKVSGKFHLLVKNGRNYGIRPVWMSTQRPQGTAKRVLELSDCYLLSGQNGNRTIEEVVKITNSEDPELMKSKLRDLPARHFLFVHENEIEELKIPDYKNAFKQH